MMVKAKTAAMTDEMVVKADRRQRQIGGGGERRKERGGNRVRARKRFLAAGWLQQFYSLVASTTIRDKWAANTRHKLIHE